MLYSINWKPLTEGAIYGGGDWALFQAQLDYRTIVRRLSDS